jgi:hypothetical protein
MALVVALAARFCASGLAGLTASSAVVRFLCGHSSAGPIDAMTSSHSIAGTSTRAQVLVGIGCGPLLAIENL